MKNKPLAPKALPNPCIVDNDAPSQYSDNSVPSVTPVGHNIPLPSISNDQVKEILTVFTPSIVAETLESLAPVIQQIQINATLDGAKIMREKVNSALSAGFYAGVPECAATLKEINTEGGLERIINDSQTNSGVLIEYDKPNEYMITASLDDSDNN